MKGDLTTHSGGVFLLGVHNLEANGSWHPSMFCCTSVEYSMGLNDLPMLNLIVGQGVPLSGSKQTASHTDGSLDDLLKEGISRRADASKLLRCTLYEASNDGTNCYAVFRGYIVNVAALIKSGNLTIKAVRVQCLGMAAILQSAPLAGFRRTNASVFVNNATGGGSEMTTNGLGNKIYVDPFTTLESTSDDLLCYRYEKNLENRDILSKMCTLLNVVAKGGEYHDSAGPDTTEDWTIDRLRIKSCLYSNCTLNKKVFPNPRAEQSLNKYIADSILSGLQQTSILSTILNTASSMDMLLALVPHFVYGGSADDFRMEIRPTDSWNASNIIEIPNRYITGVNTALNHIAHLNDPEVLIVDYSDGPGSTDGSNTSGQATGCYGIFSQSETITEWAKKRYAFTENNTAIKNQLRDQYFKTRFFRAPYWLDFSHMEDVKDISVYKTRASVPANDNEAKGGFVTIDQDNLQKKIAIADAIAQAMYVYLHGASDTATFSLTPDVRFGLSSVGCLENHLGRTVDICGYRGILQSIHYVYQSGSATNATYTISLGHVRPIDKNEKHIKCPIYTEGKSSDDESTGNDKFWRDGSPSSSLTKSQDSAKQLLGSEYGSSKLTNTAQRVHELLTTG